MANWMRVGSVYYNVDRLAKVWVTPAGRVVLYPDLRSPDDQVIALEGDDAAAFLQAWRAVLGDAGGDQEG